MDPGSCARVAFDGDEAGWGLNEVECELAGDARERGGEPLDICPDQSVWDRGEVDGRGAVNCVTDGVDGEGTDGAAAQDRVATEARAMDPFLRDVVAVGADCDSGGLGLAGNEVVDIGAGTAEDGLEGELLGVVEGTHIVHAAAERRHGCVEPYPQEEARELPFVVQHDQRGKRRCQ